MRLVQFREASGQRSIGIVSGDELQKLDKATSTYELFQYAEQRGISLEEAAERLRSNDFADYDRALSSGLVLSPLDHPDPYHLWVTGTGLTHLGSAASRNAMHEKLNDDPSKLTDSMRMFKMGVENGRMIDGSPASQPEWFYKGNGLILAQPGQELVSPSFAHDGGEEPEIAGLYINDKNGDPVRLGFALGNEFSDHAMERINYLYLAHSKIRPCSFGPELVVGPLPASISGVSSILRKGETFWSKEFLTGEENMSHNIANLEFHHFKYPMFRQPGDVHVHFFGTSVLSCLDGIKTQDGDVFQIESSHFGKPLVNTLKIK